MVVCTGFFYFLAQACESWTRDTQAMVRSKIRGRCRAPMIRHSSSGCRFQQWLKICSDVPFMTLEWQGPPPHPRDAHKGLAKGLPCQNSHMMQRGGFLLLRDCFCVRSHAKRKTHTRMHKGMEKLCAYHTLTLTRISLDPI